MFDDFIQLYDDSIKNPFFYVTIKFKVYGQ